MPWVPCFLKGFTSTFFFGEGTGSGLTDDSGDMPGDLMWTEGGLAGNCSDLLSDSPQRLNSGVFFFFFFFFFAISRL